MAQDPPSRFEIPVLRIDLISKPRYASRRAEIGQWVSEERKSRRQVESEEWRVLIETPEEEEFQKKKPFAACRKLQLQIQVR